MINVVLQDQTRNTSQAYTHTIYILYIFLIISTLIIPCGFLMHACMLIYAVSELCSDAGGHKHHDQSRMQVSLILFVLQSR